jgi:hypothetical protein
MQIGNWQKRKNFPNVNNIGYITEGFTAANNANIEIDYLFNRR